MLTDEELRKLWKATQLMGYPFGSLCQLLLATGARKSEVAFACRGEFDLDNKLWTVPPERYKTNKTHIVPLSPLALGIIDALPRNGARLFDVKDFAASKKALDVLMKGVPHFVIHDLRRVIGHTKQGLDQVYDWFEFIDERREALDAWAQKLSAIVASPTPK